MDSGMTNELGDIGDQLAAEGYQLTLQQLADGTVSAVLPDGTTDIVREAVAARIQALKAQGQPMTENEARTALAALSNAQTAALVREVLVGLVMSRPRLLRR